MDDQCFIPLKNMIQIILLFSFRFKKLRSLELNLMPSSLQQALTVGKMSYSWWIYKTSVLLLYFAYPGEFYNSVFARSSGGCTYRIP